MVQASLVQLLDALRRQKIAVGDQSRNDPVGTNAADNVIELRMQQRFTTADGDQRSAQSRQLVNAAVHLFQRNRIREIVVLIAIGAGEIAAPHRNDVYLNRMISREQTLRDHFEFAKS